MRVIIAGSRVGVSYREVERAIRESGWWDRISVVVSGGARGVDKHGEAWADQHGRPVDPYPVTEAEWACFGKAAGPMRNRRMAKNAEALIAVWDGESPGSKNMIYEAHQARLEVYIHRVLPTSSISTKGGPE